MGQFAIELMSTSPVVPVFGYRGTERGRLKSLCVNPPAVSITVASCWVLVGTMLGGRGSEYVTSVFYSGYVSGKVRNLWTGDYPFEPYEEIFISACSIIATTIRVVGKIEGGDC